MSTAAANAASATGATTPPRALYFDTPGAVTPLEAQARQFDALYFSGISLAILPPAGRERLAAVASAVRASGGPRRLRQQLPPRLWADAAEARAAFDAFHQLANIALITLDDEMALWDDGDAERQLARVCALPVGEVVVKRGAAPTRGARGRRAAGRRARRGVAQVVDTTAAGDAFAGAYLAARLAGAGATDAARAGNRLAARVIQHRGAIIPVAAMADLMQPHDLPPDSKGALT